eukprot:4877662-Amphidinium_carterae.1
MRPCQYISFVRHTRMLCKGTTSLCPLVWCVLYHATHAVKLFEEANAYLTIHMHGCHSCQVQYMHVTTPNSNPFCHKRELTLVGLEVADLTKTCTMDTGAWARVSIDARCITFERAKTGHSASTSAVSIMSYIWDCEAN